VIRAALRDLQWRRRRVAIAVVATALVLTVAIVLAGLVASISQEADRATDRVGADRWLVSSSSVGPFSNGAPFAAALAEQVAADPGVTAAEPMLFTAQAVDLDGPEPLIVMGVQPGGMADPSTGATSPLATPGHVVVDSRAGLDVGDTVRIGRSDLEVVGTVDGRTMLGGVPVLFASITDVQEALLLGQPLATSILTKGVPTALPDGLKAMTASDVRGDARLVLRRVLDSLAWLRLLMWVVAAAIVASAVYLSALERSRDFAVFKATGASTRSIGVGVVLQAVVLAVGAAALAAGLAGLVAPRFPIPVTLPARSLVVAMALAALVGALASAFGLVRVARAQPALAFGG
jgi:putative ABC transport system permease protein